MARQFDDVQLEYLTVPTPVLTASAPIAMCCWFKSDDVSNGYCLMSICDSAGNADNIALYAQGAVGGDPVRFQMSDVGGWDIADTTAGYTAMSCFTRRGRRSLFRGWRSSRHAHHR
ncbi:hypothetical protein LCGC14_3024310 [marine sediment metagenome]|uniref:Uncharacterized protein n=1 Tax=marine sediment metagenome TaxID=412755 RepID=A0A0F8WU80_9ZZZZ